MDELICDCFQYTIDDIKNDYKKNGKSLILGKIKQNEVYFDRTELVAEIYKLQKNE